MRVIMRKKSGEEGIKDIEDELIERYGSIDSLGQRTGIEKCSHPEIVDDYEVWKAIKKGAIIEEEIIFSDYSIFNALSASRVEMLELIRKNRYGSIKELAQALKRDYKNVYFDLRALTEYNLVEIRKKGRDRMPISRVESIEIVFD